MNINVLMLLTGIVLVVLTGMYVYYYTYQMHQYEMNKIRILECKYRKQQQERNEIAKMTDPCPVPNLNSPRTCYFNSNYKCSWNEKIDRCDKL